MEWIPNGVAECQEDFSAALVHKILYRNKLIGLCGEGAEGSRGVTILIDASGVLKLVSQNSIYSEGGVAQGCSGSYKKCAQRLSSPYKQVRARGLRRRKLLLSIKVDWAPSGFMDDI
jgi:hypothetical protein